MIVLVVVQTVLVGLLAGEEFIVRWGVQPALTRLPEEAHVRARIALVRSLRIVVPALMLPTVVVSAAVVVLDRSGDVTGIRVAASAALVVFVLASFLGTVPINIGVADWDPEHPPADWRRTVQRWERIDVLRSSAAVFAFVLSVVALAVP